MFLDSLNSTFVAHGIQFAITPVFLLTAIAGMISVLTQRLGRIVDRGRDLEEALSARRLERPGLAWRELDVLHRRATIVNYSLVLFTLSALSVAFTTAGLFLDELSKYSVSVIVTGTFLLALLLFVLGLLCYLAEVTLSRHAFRFTRSKHIPSKSLGKKHWFSYGARGFRSKTNASDV